MLLAATITFAAAIYGLEHLPVWGAVKTAAAQWLLLSLFSLIGGAIYERRHALGHEPQVSPERTAEREWRERDRRRAALLVDAYVPARIHEAEQVIGPLRRWLDESLASEIEADTRAFLARAADWNDARAHALVAQLVIARLLAARSSRSSSSCSSPPTMPCPV